MYERGDLRTLHEPFIYLYYVGDAKKVLMHFDVDPAHPTTYVDIRSMVLAAAERGPVFFKDMSYYVTDYIFGDPVFVKRLTNTFLIRTPRKSIPSYFKIDNKVLSEEIGLEAEWRHFEFVKETTGQTPVVVDAENLQTDTEATIRRYCQCVGLEFIAESLRWDEPVPPEWQHVAGWHGDLNKTSQIGVRGGGELSVDDDEHLRGFFEHHNPFYEKLRRYRIEV